MKIEYRLERSERTISVEEYVRECVDVPYFRDLCRQCPNYNKTWSCPEFDFDVMEYWKKYRFMRIISMKIILPDGLQDKSFTKEEVEAVRDSTLWEVKRSFTEELFELEKEVEGSVHLSAGFCLLCGSRNCAKQKGMPCRFPDKLRYSIEALGGNVTKAAAYLGQELEWTAPDKIPHHYLLVGALLY